MSMHRSNDPTRTAQSLLRATLDKIEPPHILVRRASSRMTALGPIDVDAAIVRKLAISPPWVDSSTDEDVLKATLITHDYFSGVKVVYAPEKTVSKDDSGSDVTHYSFKILARTIAGEEVEDDHTVVCVDLYWNYDARTGATLWTESYSFSESRITTHIAVTKNSVVVTTVGVDGRDVVTCTQEQTGNEFNSAVLRKNSVTVLSPDGHMSTCIYREKALVLFRSTSAAEGGYFDRLVANICITPAESDIRICNADGVQLAHTLIAIQPRKRGRDD